MKKVFFLLFMVISSPAFSWELGVEGQSYVCFRESSELPVKVTIDKYGDIKITWGEYPIEYDFMFYDSDKLISGGICVNRRVKRGHVAV